MSAPKRANPGSNIAKWQNHRSGRPVDSMEAFRQSFTERCKQNWQAARSRFFNQRRGLGDDSSAENERTSEGAPTEQGDGLDAYLYSFLQSELASYRAGATAAPGTTTVEASSGLASATAMQLGTADECFDNYEAALAQSTRSAAENDEDRDYTDDEREEIMQEFMLQVLQELIEQERERNLALYDDYEKALQRDEAPRHSADIDNEFDVEDDAESAAYFEEALRQADSTVCPLCWQGQLSQRMQAIMCNHCGFAMDTQFDSITLPQLQATIHERLQAHSAACPQRPFFSYQANVAGSLLHLRCNYCDCFEVV